jgi:hypothetical protein
MRGQLYTYFADDHRRIETLLDRAVRDPQNVDKRMYTDFRAALLKHIGMEEKLLFPTLQRHRNGEPHPAVARLHLDHGAIAALLVLPPEPVVVAALRSILAGHNDVEEGAGSVYEEADRLPLRMGEDLFERLLLAPEVPISPHIDNPGAIDAARRALLKSGYNLDDYEIHQ